MNQPTNDWRLLDFFTTAPNANATRGQLSVNQTNLACLGRAADQGVIVLQQFRRRSPTCKAGCPELHPAGD